MPLDWLLADYRRPGTHRVYDYRHPTAKEMLYGTHETTGGYDVEWDPDLHRLQYRRNLFAATLVRTKITRADLQ